VGTRRVRLGTGYKSGSWDAGEVASLVTPWLELTGLGEFFIDDTVMSTEGRGFAVVPADNLIRTAQGAC
jgi:hypothetical protein